MAIMARLKQRPDFGFMRDTEFRAAFHHGLAIAAGGIVGLCVWAGWQGPAPSPYRDSVVITPFRLITDEQKVELNTADIPEHPADAPQTAPTETVTYTDHRPDIAPNKATLPMPGLTEARPPYGNLPRIRKEDKLHPFDAYRQPFASDQLTKPLVAVVMLDYGLSDEASGSILGVMPPEVNVAVSPAARNPKIWAQKAFDHGHELWLELAAEPPGYPNIDPGANALLTTSPVEKNQAALYTQMGSVVGYAGFIGRDASPYYASGADADFMAGLIYDRGLGLALNTDHADPILKSEAIRTKSPFYAGHMVMLDDPLNAAGLARAFAQVEATAHKKGFAIALFHPSNLARKEVLDWLSTLKTKDLTLTPLSVIVERGVGLTP